MQYNNFKPPSNLIFDQNVSKNFDKFMQAFEIYLSASELRTATDERKVAIFLNVAGEEALDVFNTFNLSDAHKKVYKEVVKAFTDYCKPRSNETFDRFKFFSRVKQEDENFDSFIKDLKLLAKPCNFGTQEESLIRDRLILGISEHQLQERLLRTPELKLGEAEKMVRAAEATQLQVKGLKGEAEINVISKRFIPGNKTETSGSKKNVSNDIYQCYKCGTKHKKGECIAYGKLCNICNNYNHFAVGCRFRNRQNVNREHSNNTGQQSKAKFNKKGKNYGKNVHEFEQEMGQDEPYIDSIILNNIDYKNKVNNIWSTEIIINNKKVVFKLDTGASCNCLPLKVFGSLNVICKIEKTDLSLITYGNNRINALGYVTLTCVVKNRSCRIRFVLVDVGNMPILGLNACVKLDLIQKVEAVDVTQKSLKTRSEFIYKNKSVFEGTGKIPYSYKIVLKKDAIPFVSSCRRVPDMIKPKLKGALDDLEERGIIVRRDEPTEWVNNLVIVEKSDGTLRLCLDPVHLNKYICADQYPIPTVEELALKLKGKKIFSVLDLKDGFFHVPLDSDSSKYCTFITPFGKYSFLRLPFGLSVSPQVFQKINEKIFGDLPVGIYFDDFIIAAETEVVHDQILERVIKRAEQFGVKFNKNKVQYKVSEVSYVGQVFSSEGVRPDSQYVQAILELEEPKNKKELLRNLGMINYLTKYLPNLSDLLYPLRGLIKNNAQWVWTKDHSECFNKIKVLIAKAPTLQIFDGNLPIEVQTDASQFGIGGCLLQNGQPVAFCSRSLTDAESRWAQIEKEFLAVSFSLNKFHHYIYGRRVLVKSDHKPLVVINQKDICKVSSRLQRLKMRLLKYNFTIEYLPGKYMYIADLLSRSFIKTPVEDDPDMLDVVHSIELELPISDERLQELRRATIEDAVLSRVGDYCNFGWPENRSQIANPEVEIYMKIKENLHTSGGLLFNNYKLVVPTKLRSLMLSKLHTGHFGIEKSKARARKIFYWPGMSNDIHNFVSKCKTCLKYGRNVQKEPLIQHERPEIPFAKVAADIFTYAGCDFLTVVDYYSNWLELFPLKFKTATEVIEKLKVIFSTHGIPSVFVSDNMPFNSKYFKTFSKDWGFQLITSSPHYPKSNGLAERAVGICKNMLKKCNDSSSDIYLALLEYRTSPLSGINLSPSEILNNRILRTALPVCTKLLTDKARVNPDNFKEKREKMKMYYDRQAEDRCSFNQGQSVMLKKDNWWVPAEIVSKCDTPRSYWVKDDYDRVYRRNSSFLKASPNPFELRSIPEYDQLSRSGETQDAQHVTPPIQPDNEQLVDRSVSIESQKTCSPVNMPKVSNNSSGDINYQTRSGRTVRKPMRYRD